ncbi:hypothetical protein ABKN59_011892 [Abortiporus biennis]
MWQRPGGGLNTSNCILNKLSEIHASKVENNLLSAQVLVGRTVKLHEIRSLDDNIGIYRLPANKVSGTTMTTCYWKNQVGIDCLPAIGYLEKQAENTPDHFNESQGIKHLQPQYLTQKSLK